MNESDREVEIVEGAIELLPYFRSINEEWIQDMFALEPTDRHVLEHAKELILDRGGRILFARDHALGVVGTCALLEHGDSRFELTKMGVTGHARGRGIGDRLLVAALACTESMPAKDVFLLTNSRCEAAIHLYEKHGFKHDTEIMHEYGPLYRRCDVAMRYSPGLVESQSSVRETETG